MITVGILSIFGYNIYREKQNYELWQKEIQCSGLKGVWCWVQNIFGGIIDFDKEHKGTIGVTTGIFGIAGCLGAVVLAFGSGGIGTPAVAVCGLIGAGTGIGTYGMLGGTPASALLGITGGAIAPLLTGLIFAVGLIFLASSFFGIENVIKIPYVSLFLGILGFVMGLMFWQWVYDILPYLIVVLVLGIGVFLFIKKQS